MPDHQEEELFRAMPETARETENTYEPGHWHPGDVGLSQEKKDQLGKGRSTSMKPHIDGPCNFQLPSQPDHIDYIYGIDPISNTLSGVGAVILKQERKARLKKNDTLVGPNGHKFKITKVSKWDFIHRLLSIGKKYYNSRIYLTAEK